MQLIPIKAVPNQTFIVSLDGQTCQINIYQKSTGLFVDVYINNDLVIAGVLARNLCRIVLGRYLGFSGDLMFIDNQGSSDPIYGGLGDRYVLAYLSASELPSNALYR